MVQISVRRVRGERAVRLRTVGEPCAQAPWVERQVHVDALDGLRAGDGPVGVAVVDGQAGLEHLAGGDDLRVVMLRAVLVVPPHDAPGDALEHVGGAPDGGEDDVLPVGFGRLQRDAFQRLLDHVARGLRAAHDVGQLLQADLALEATLVGVAQQGDAPGAGGGDVALQWVLEDVEHLLGQRSGGPCAPLALSGDAPALPHGLQLHVAHDAVHPLLAAVHADAGLLEDRLHGPVAFAGCPCRAPDVGLEPVELLHGAADGGLSVEARPVLVRAHALAGGEVPDAPLVLAGGLQPLPVGELDLVQIVASDGG